jgi:hypothetical protein
MMHRHRGAILGLALLALIIATVGPHSARAQSTQRCFPETGYCIEGRIRDFWERNGGLPVFGYPTSPLQLETIENRQLQVQWFERNRLELHPENSPPYDVLLGRLGSDLLTKQGRDWFAFPKSTAQPGCRFFPETGHNICGALLAAWQSNGLELDGRRGKSEAESLALIGLPLSDAQVETLSNGQPYTVQWFERARLELHPENQPPYDVLFGLIGNETRGPNSPPPAAPAPSEQTQQIGPIQDRARGQEYSLEITLKSFRWSNGESYETPQPGYVYVVAQVNIKNLGPGSRSFIGPNHLQVMDANRAVYDYTIVSHLTEDCYRRSVDLAAGGSVEGCVAFEVPATGRIDLIFAPYQYDNLGPGRYLSFNLRP